MDDRFKLNWTSVGSDVGRNGELSVMNWDVGDVLVLAESNYRSGLVDKTSSLRAVRHRCKYLRFLSYCHCVSKSLESPSVEVKGLSLQLLVLSQAVSEL